MRFDEALSYLLSLGHETLAIKLGLTNTERLLAALGDPQKSFPSVQIAGTNGKGSTAVMLESVARAAGVRTGLYTSPHLVSITERVRVDNMEVSREEFARLTARVREAAERLVSDGVLPALPTFFEHVTAVALAAFAESRVGLAILETGLGGRLDATTTARADVVAITPVALDHQEHLGETLSEIASEKAAIIRPNVAAVVAPQEAEALEVILRRCAECGVVPRMAATRGPLVLGADETGRLRVSFETSEDRYENVRLALRGRHQILNAQVAISLAETLRGRGFPLTRAAIIEGLETARHAGRLELRRFSEHDFLFDGAHNPAGARALRAFLDEFVHAPVTLLFGAMRDKPLSELAATLFPAASHLILTQPANPRAAPPETLARLVPREFDLSRITLAPSAAEAVTAALAETPPAGLICVTGSLYLVGEVQGLLGRT
ncbi:MAG TPA: folylpolyglutamate synthase/dihydrofolate synthase family protein [Pyrinomonadaceae bacterium]|nr:folylpolyglutamate synthase/dihydrofolate synthase family protein [Pyrinomonadaceae bacterium]